MHNAQIGLLFNLLVICQTGYEYNNNKHKILTCNVLVKLF